MKSRLSLFSSQPKSVRTQSYAHPLMATITIVRIVALALTTLAGSADAIADEPMQKFADALRERGYFDVAVDYLEQVKPASLSEESQSLLPLEKATTYRQAAMSSRDLSEADTLLAAAQQAIATYQPKENSDADTAKAEQFLGDVLFSRARVTKARTANGNGKNSRTQTEQLNDQIRSHLNASEKAYAASTKSLTKALKNFQLDPEDSSTTTELIRLRAQYTYLQTRRPTIKEQLADSLNGQKRKRKELLKEAASEAEAVWSKYRQHYQKYPPAIQSCLTAASCYQKLEELESSQKMIKELLTIDRSSVSASLRREALSIAATNWQSTKPFPWETVLAETEAPVKTLSPQQALNPQWQSVQLVLAQALHEKSKSLAGEKGTSAKSDAQAASETAVKLATSIVQAGGDNRDQAFSLLKEWGADSDAPTQQASTPGVKAESFAKAVQLGKAILPEIDSTFRLISATDRKIRRASDAPERQQLEKELNKLKQQQFTKTDAALDLFNQAIHLTDESVTRAQINDIRYLQSYCYFARQQHIESAVIAEFLVDNYPNSDRARPAAAILIRNNAAILDKSTDNKAQKNEQLASSCKAIIDRYPGTSEAFSAAARLASLSLGDGNVAEAKKWFDMIPQGDPQRTGLALSMGRREWFAWSKSNATQTSENKEQLAIAKQYLAEGVAAAKPESLTYAAAEGSLLLTQALVASGEVDAAIKQLESAEIAPLKLVEPAHRALTSTGRTNLYHRQTVTTAIKCYMAAIARSNTGQDKWIDKSGQVIAGLQKRLQTSSDPDDVKRLAFVYRLISESLIKQFDSLAVGKPRADFAVRLASLLSNIEKQSQDARTVVWAGSTMLSVANSLRQDGAATQSETIFAQAISALDRAEKIGFGDGADSEAMTREMKRQRALAQRGAGDYAEALQQFAQLLTAKSGDLSIQLDAAITLQQQAAAKKDVKSFTAAILGSNPVVDPKTKRKQNAIWGWRKLVQVTRGRNQFQDAFYQSLYNMIEARYELGRINQSPEGISKALKELDNWQQRNPDFDNGTWKQKFAELRRRIQKQ